MSDGFPWLLFADACMVGVILSVQLVVYPALPYFSESALVQWHRRYTGAISLLVVPLMTGQLLGGFYWFLTHPDIGTGVYVFLVCLLWGITFQIFMPLHRRIGQGNAERKDLSLLVSRNWYRSVLWLLLFAWHLGIYTGWFPYG